MRRKGKVEQSPLPKAVPFQNLNYTTGCYAFNPKRGTSMEWL